MISSVRFNDVIIVESASEELRSGSWNNAFRNASAYGYIDEVYKFEQFEYDRNNVGVGTECESQCSCRTVLSSSFLHYCMEELKIIRKNTYKVYGFHAVEDCSTRKKGIRFSHCLNWSCSEPVTKQEEF